MIEGLVLGCVIVGSGVFLWFAVLALVQACSKVWEARLSPARKAAKAAQARKALPPEPVRSLLWRQAMSELDDLEPDPSFRYYPVTVAYQPDELEAMPRYQRPDGFVPTTFIPRTERLEYERKLREQHQRRIELGPLPDAIRIGEDQVISSMSIPPYLIAEQHQCACPRCRDARSDDSDGVRNGLGDVVLSAVTNPRDARHLTPLFL